MVGVEDRNEDVAEEEASGPSSVPDAAARVPAPSAEDGGVIFVLEKASLEATKVGKVKKTKEIPSPFLFGRRVGSFSFEGVVIEMSIMKGIIKVMPHGDEDCALPFVEASGGELWVHVLQVLGYLIFCTISLFNLSLSLVSSLS